MTLKCLTSDTEDCRNCYKCIRHCPVKAISFESNKASILHEKCILCGSCYNVCPEELKKIRNDISAVRNMMTKGSVIASIAPSFISYYRNTDISCMKKTLKSLGFTDVEETAIGATIVKSTYDRMAEEGRDILISSSCHSINLLIEKYYPDCLPYLADVLTPMQAHGKDIKRRFGKDAFVVFIGPCIAKKDEADSSEWVDAALTFKELDEWVLKEKISMHTTEKPDSDEFSRARLFPTEGGILKTMNCTKKNTDYLAVSGVENAKKTLNDIQNGLIHNCFIEMSACEGSCVNGPVSNRERSIVYKNSAVNSYAGYKDFVLEEENNDISTEYLNHRFPDFVPSEKEINDMLRKMNKANKEDRLNCGSCGYDTCKDKAVAILQGYAKIEMCLPMLMKRSQSLTEDIIANTSSGIMALNENLEIELINKAMCRLIGIHDPADVIGSHIAAVYDPTDFIEVMEGKPVRDRREYISDYELYVEKTISYDDKNKMFVCIMRDVTEEEKKKQTEKEMIDNTIAITDSLLANNLKSVHEIAFLLGETSAETKVAIEKLKDLVKKNE